MQSNIKSNINTVPQNMKIGWYSEKQRNAVWECQKSSYNDNKQRYCAHVYLQPNGKEVQAKVKQNENEIQNTIK